MLKKFFAAILVVSLLMIESTALAAYPKYLGGDRNYILFDGHMGGARYLVRNSVQVVGDDSYAIVLSADWVAVGDADRGGTKISGRYNCRFGYQWSKGKAFNITSGKWNPVNPNMSRAAGGAFAGAAEIAFYLASNGKKFFGTYSDSFYPDL